MRNVMMGFQLIVSLGLVILILLQTKGSGLTSSGMESGTYHSKKGVEKLIFVITVILAGLFLTTSLINAFLL